MKTRCFTAWHAVILEEHCSLLYLDDALKNDRDDLEGQLPSPCRLTRFGAMLFLYAQAAEIVTHSFQRNQKKHICFAILRILQEHARLPFHDFHVNASTAPTMTPLPKIMPELNRCQPRENGYHVTDKFDAPVSIGCAVFVCWSLTMQYQQRPSQDSS